MKIGLQLYTLRKEIFSGNVPEILRKVKSLGYDGVEWFGTFPGYGAAKLAEVTRDSGLEFFSIHTDINGLKSPNRDDLKIYSSAGVRYMPIGWLPEDRIAGGENFTDTLETIRNFAKIARGYGITLLYHNHDFDLARLADGTPKLDILYKELPPDILSAELDTCWLYSGGVDTVKYVTKYADRTPILHLKDCVPEGGRTGFMPVGYGVLNFSEILRASKADWLCVEQDEPTPSYDEWESCRMAIDYLRKIG